MKKLILALALIVSTGAFAQSTMQDDVDIVQSVYGKSKKELVAGYMTNLDSTQNSKFWKMYDEYEMERKALGQKKIALINDYGNNFTSLTDAKADEIAKGSLANNLAYDKLFSKFYEKSKRDVGALNAAKFIQLEITQILFNNKSGGSKLIYCLFAFYCKSILWHTDWRDILFFVYRNDRYAMRNSFTNMKSGQKWKAPFTFCVWLQSF